MLGYLLSDVCRALHEQRLRQRVRGRLHGSSRHHACSSDSPLQACARRLAPAMAAGKQVSSSMHASCLTMRQTCVVT